MATVSRTTTEKVDDDDDGGDYIDDKTAGLFSIIISNLSQRVFSPFFFSIVTFDPFRVLVTTVS